MSKITRPESRPRKHRPPKAVWQGGSNRNRDRDRSRDRDRDRDRSRTKSQDSDFGEPKASFRTGAMDGERQQAREQGQDKVAGQRLWGAVGLL